MAKKVVLDSCVLFELYKVHTGKPVHDQFRIDPTNETILKKFYEIITCENKNEKDEKINFFITRESYKEIIAGVKKGYDPKIFNFRKLLKIKILDINEKDYRLAREILSSYLMHNIPEEIDNEMLFGKKYNENFRNPYADFTIMTICALNNMNLVTLDKKHFFGKNFETYEHIKLVNSFYKVRSHPTSVKRFLYKNFTENTNLLNKCIEESKKINSTIIYTHENDEENPTNYSVFSMN